MVLEFLKHFRGGVASNSRLENADMGKEGSQVVSIVEEKGMKGSRNFCNSCAASRPQ